MKLITNVLLKVLILCILPMPATRDDIYSWQDKIEGFLALKDFVLNETLSDLVEDDEQNSNGGISENFNLTNVSEGCVGDFVDLDDDCNQTAEHTFNMPKFKTEKRKHSLEISCECQPPVKRRKRKLKIQTNYSEEDLLTHKAEFDHKSSGLFLFSVNNFKIEEYKSLFKLNGSVFIEEFCSKEQFQDINLNVFLRLNEMVEKNFEKLEVYAKRVVVEYVEIYKLKSKDSKIIDPDFYKTINKALDPARTKGFYYLLIYSFYETGLIGVPRCIAAVEKILLNIITHTRLMAYMHNDKVKEEIKPKKLFFSQKVLSKMSISKQKKYSATNFRYTDFTKALFGKPFKKHDLFCKNADLMRREIDDNIQLIINEEFGDNPGYKKLCEDYNSKVLEFSRSILFERLSFKIGKDVIDNFLPEDVDYNDFMCGNGYPRNILSYLMVTDTKKPDKRPCRH